MVITTVTWYTSESNPLPSKPITFSKLMGCHNNDDNKRLYGWLGSLMVTALDLQLAGCKFNSRPRHCWATILGKLFTPTCLCRSQWFSGGMTDCGVRGRGQLCLSRQPLRCTALDMGCLPAVSRPTQPTTLCRTVKWVSAFGLNNNNKWRWWMWMVAIYIGGLTAQVGWLGLGVGSHPAFRLHSSNEPGQLSQWLWSRWQHHKRWCIIIIVIVSHHNWIVCTGSRCVSSHGTHL